MPHHRKRNRRLTVSYLLALVLIAAIIVGQYLALQINAANKASQTNAIFISGQQLNLSQRIAFLINELRLSQDIHRYLEQQQRAYTAIEQMRAEHEQLINGDRNVPLRRPSTQLQVVYFDEPHNLNRTVKIFLTHAASLANRPIGSIESSDPILKKTITLAEQELYQGLNAAMELHRQELLTNQNTAQLLHSLFLAIGMGILIVVAAFIFMPLVSTIKQHVRRIEQDNQSLQRVSTARQAFIQCMVRQVKQPVTALIDHAENIKLADTDNQQLLKQLLDIRANVDLLSNYVQDFSLITELQSLNANDLMLPLSDVVEIAQQYQCHFYAVAKVNEDEHLALNKHHLILFIETLRRLTTSHHNQPISMQLAHSHRGLQLIFNLPVIDANSLPFKHEDGDNQDSRALLLNTLAKLYNGRCHYDSNDSQLVCHLHC